jgi:hypothetical protein
MVQYNNPKEFQNQPRIVPDGCRWPSVVDLKHPMSLIAERELLFGKMDEICANHGGVLVWSFERSRKRDDEFTLRFSWKHTGLMRQEFTGSRVGILFEAARQYWQSHNL